MKHLIFLILLTSLHVWTQELFLSFNIEKIENILHSSAKGRFQLSGLVAIKSRCDQIVMWEKNAEDNNNQINEKLFGCGLTITAPTHLDFAFAVSKGHMRNKNGMFAALNRAAANATDKGTEQALRMIQEGRLTPGGNISILQHMVNELSVKRGFFASNPNVTPLGKIGIGIKIDPATLKPVNVNRKKQIFKGSHWEIHVTYSIMITKKIHRINIPRINKH